MPLPPLTDPASASRRARALALAVPSSGLLFGSLLVLNAAQTASLALRPFSMRSFRGFNRWAADTWWGWCVTSSERLHGVRLIVSGDPVPARENAIVVSNHQQMPDITFLMIWARQKERLGDLKWVVKDPIKYVPGVGWGMAFLDCVFVKRNWTDDRASVEQTFAQLTGNRVPFWLVSFPEGTRVSEAKVEQSQDYARAHGLLPLWHVLVPRTKGFTASVAGLREHADAVYDVTIGYEEGVPTLWQFIKGYARRAHLHVRRFPIRDLPESEAELALWLQRRFEEKDALLEHFYREGAFPDAG
jgi:1-acyl-sn-glycerol-3-phosphate acyltransferase